MEWAAGHSTLKFCGATAGLMSGKGFIGGCAEYVGC